MTHNEYLEKIINEVTKLIDLTRMELFAAWAEELDNGGWDSPKQAKQKNNEMIRKLRNEYQLYTTGQIIGEILREKYLAETERDIEIEIPSSSPPVP